MKNIILVLIGLVFISSCSTLYYSFWEKLGKEKRDLLKSNISKMNTEQNEVKKSLDEVMQEIRKKYPTNNKELESFYDHYSSEYDQMSKRSESLKERGQKVDEIANDLFKEWEAEIEQLENEKYKVDSQSKLNETKKSYRALISQAHSVEMNMDKILAKMKDQTLYLKHNLNAASLNSFKSAIFDIKEEMAQLTQEIEKATGKAEKFLEQY